MNRPKLMVVIRANGAGKTTWGRHHLDRLPLNFYNADVIAEGLGDANSTELQARARSLVDGETAERLQLGESFGFESTRSGKSRPAIVRDASERGYETHAVFLGTAHPALNIARVRRRGPAGGHHVPENEIVRRWTAAFEMAQRGWLYVHASFHPGGAGARTRKEQHEAACARGIVYKVFVSGKEAVRAVVRVARMQVWPGP